MCKAERQETDRNNDTVRRRDAAIWRRDTIIRRKNSKLQTLEKERQGDIETIRNYKEEIKQKNHEIKTLQKLFKEQDIDDDQKHSKQVRTYKKYISN